MNSILCAGCAEKRGLQYFMLNRWGIGDRLYRRAIAERKRKRCRECGKLYMLYYEPVNEHGGEMTPEKQRIAIAEACGWKWYVAERVGERFLRPPDYQPPFHTIRLANGSEPQSDEDLHCPDYLNDLNAMHEAEKTLKFEQIVFYANELLSLTKTYAPEEHLYALCHATAAQRAEAFLKTLGLWEDE